MMLANDYEKLARDGVSAEKLANIFLNDYYGKDNIVFPINPFQILTDLGIPFVFRPFKNYEGVYIPCTSKDDIPIIGINLNRPIVRQRFTAAHELCHHLKDINNGFVCVTNSKKNIERYAEDFASELLMPMEEFKKQTHARLNNGYLDMDGVLEVANYFGVSFQACLNKVAYRLHLVDGDTSPDTLKKKAKVYKPQIKRVEKGWYYTKLNEQLLNAIGNNFQLISKDYARQKFKVEYIFHDSRMEGVDVDKETFGDIVSDLRIKKQDSLFCKEENRNIIEIAGLSLAYDYVFENAQKTSVFMKQNILTKNYIQPHRILNLVGIIANQMPLY